MGQGVQREEGERRRSTPAVASAVSRRGGRAHPTRWRLSPPGDIPERWPSSALPRPACHELTHSRVLARWVVLRPVGVDRSLVVAWYGGKERSRAELSPKQPDARLRLRYSASPAPDRQAIVLALDDVVDLEDLGLTGLDPSVFQYRHEALAERVELLPRIPDLTDDELAVRFEGDVELESLRQPVPRLLQLGHGLVVLLRGHMGRGREAGENARLPCVHDRRRGRIGG